MSSAYCSRSDLSIWGTTVVALQSVEPVVQDAAIAGGAAMIESYLASRISGLPLTSWGVDIRRANAIIAAYDLIAASRGRNPEETSEQDPLLVRYNSVLKWLRDVAQGIVTSSAVGTTPAPAPAVAAGVPQIVSNTQRGWQNNDGTGTPFSGSR